MRKAIINHKTEFILTIRAKRRENRAAFFECMINAAGMFGATGSISNKGEG
jgi:hypothetical protein